MAEVKYPDGHDSRVQVEFPGERNQAEALAELKETAFDRYLLIFTSAIFCLVVIFVITQVVIRYLTVHIGFSLPWTEEAARYLLIMVTFFGSAIAWRKKEHITITSLVDYLPPRVKLVFDFISALLILGFLLIAIYGSYSFTLKMMIAPVGAIGWLKVGHLYGLMTLGLFLIGVYVVRWIVYYVQEIIRSWGKGVCSRG